MKRFLMCLMFVIVPLCLPAQGYKMIRGMVRDSSGKGIEAVSIAAESTRLVFVTDSKGAFTAYVPEFVKSFEFSKQGYLRKTVKVSGYLSVLMDRDPEIAKALVAKKAEKAAILARKALEDSLTAVAEKERISREIKKEVDEAMASRKDTVIIRQTTETVIIEKEAPVETSGPRNRFSYKLDLGYTGQFASDDVVYKNSGTQITGNQSPLSLEFTFYVNFGKYTSLGVGAGASFATKGIMIPGDNVSTDLYGGYFVEKRFDIPVFADARFIMGKSRIHPVISVSGGIYAISVTPLGRAGVGCQFSCFKKVAPFVDLSVGTSPFPYFSETGKTAGYRAALGLSVKLGIIL